MVVGTNVLRIILKLQDEMSKKLVKSGLALRAFRATTKKLYNAIRHTQRLFLALGLAALFFGMALKNVTQRAIKSIISTWAEAMEGTIAYNQTLGRLNAAFEFLKFAIADAFLSSEFGIALIDMLIVILETIAQMPKESLMIIGKWLLYLFLLGTALMVFGQLMLALLGILGIISFMVILMGGPMTAAILGVGSAWLLWGDRLGKLGIILVAFGLLIIAVGLLFGAWPLILIGVIVILIAILWSMRWEMELIFEHIGSSLIRAFQYAIEKVRGGLNKLLKAWNSKVPEFMQIPELTGKQGGGAKFLNDALERSSHRQAVLLNKIKTSKSPWEKMMEKVSAPIEQFKSDYEKVTSDFKSAGEQTGLFPKAPTIEAAMGVSKGEIAPVINEVNIQVGEAEAAGKDAQELARTIADELGLELTRTGQGAGT